VDVGADGQAFLDERSRLRGTTLAKIRGTGSGPVQSRAIVRGLAYQADANPDRWQLGPYRLVTWGGERYNRLLAALLTRADPSLEFSATAFEVRGLLSHLPITLEWLRDLAEDAKQRNDLPISIAQKFAGGSRFINELSPDAQAQEKRSAVPWDGFLRWLETVEMIEAEPDEEVTSGAL
jgi:hypothetical protein